MQKRWITVAAVVVGLGSAVSAFLAWFPRTPENRVYIVGYQNSPPRQMVAADGSPYGPVIDALREAARREGIRLSWKHVPERHDDAIAEGQVDLWPIIANVPARRSRFYISAPFAELAFWAVVLRSSGIESIDQLANRKVAFSHALFQTAMKLPAPNIELVRQPNGLQALQEVCAARVSAAIIADNMAEGPAFAAFQSCGELKFIPVPGGRLSFGFGATRRNPGAVAAADRLRARISELAHDGTLSGIQMRWYSNPTQETLLLEKLAAEARTNRMLLILSVALACALASSVLLAIRLRSAVRSAQRATTAKSEFLANVSHEIRTPMNGILGMTELALPLARDSELREYLSDTKRSAESLLGLLNDVLDFSKIEAGKIELANEPFHIRAELTAALSPLILLARQKGVDFKLEIAPGVPTTVKGDLGRLRQVLNNIAGNAVKFTSEGAITVRLRALSTSAESTLCRFSVTDTGIGIPAENHERIFQVFEQGGLAKTRKFGGSGLGLAISRNLLRLMGGAIEVESPWMDPDGRVHPGSAFHFTVPFGVASAAPARPEPPTAPDCRPLRVLLAEDNEINSKLARRVLEIAGHKVIVARTGAEAVRLHQEQQPELIFMDVQMPEMDGFEATNLIREAERSTGRHTPIIAMTAHAMTGDRERCIEAGMDSYIAKPIAAAELHRAILATLEKSAAPESAGP